jgi:hypothetical protein
MYFTSELNRLIMFSLIKCCRLIESIALSSLASMPVHNEKGNLCILCT